VAAVDSSGLLRALSPGTARIVVTAHALGTRARLAEGMGDTVSVRVAPPDPAFRSMRFVDVAAQAGEFGGTCAVGTDGAAWCWGYSLEDDTDDDGGDGRMAGFERTAGPEPFASVTLGGGHTCALARSGRAYCWGDNTEGQAGAGNRRQTAKEPSPVAGGHLWRQLSAGGSRTCGVDVQGALFCWGSDRDGELAPARISTLCPESLLGFGRPRGERWRCALAPAPVLPGMRFAEVAVGGGHVCALQVGGAVWCWGDNWNHQSSPAPPAAGRFPHADAAAADGAPVRWAAPQLRSGHRRAGLLLGLVRAPGASGHGAGTRLPSPDRDRCRHRAAVGGVGLRARLRHRRRRPRLVLGQQLRLPARQRIRGGGRGYRRRRSRGGRRAVSRPGPALGNGYTCGVSIQGGLYCWGSGLNFRFRGGNTQETPLPFRLAGPAS
jgi:hypothetical protein